MKHADPNLRPQDHPVEGCLVFLIGMLCGLGLAWWLLTGAGA